MAETNKYFLSFHTVFILNENIKWIEEFLLYYINLGFDHFYLYDNEGSKGFYGDNTKNRWGNDIVTTNSSEDEEAFRNLREKFPGKITVVKWSPRNAEGNIHYGQVEAVHHFMKNYGHETEWVALMDFDEFLFSPSNINILQYLKDTAKDVSLYFIKQDSYQSRFDTVGPVTQNFSTILGSSPHEFVGQKTIVRPSQFLKTGNIHYYFETTNHKVFVPKHILKFHHYNVNQLVLNDLEKVYHFPMYLTGFDDSMKRYAYLYGGVSGVSGVSGERPTLVFIVDPILQFEQLVSKLEYVSKTYRIVIVNGFNFFSKQLVEDIARSSLCFIHSNVISITTWNEFNKVFDVPKLVELNPTVYANFLNKSNDEVYEFLRMKESELKKYQHRLTTVDRFLYINLERRPDRRKHIEDQFERAGIAPERVLRINAFEQKGFGHLGCAKSQVAELELAYQNGWTWTAFFEDDFTFHRPETFLQEVGNALREFKPDVLLLSYNPDAIDFEPTHDPTIIRIKRSVTASGYIVHRSYLKTMLDSFKEARDLLERDGPTAVWHCIDQHWAPLQARDKFYGFRKPIGYQIEGHSDITGHYVNYKC